MPSLPSGPLKVPGPEGFRGDLLACSPDLLDLTWDQMRTLVVVHEEGTALAAARLLGREQSSVQKQLDILNRNFQDLTGELVVVKQGRGRDLLFTPTGLEVMDRIRSTFSDWLQGIANSRRRLGSTLTVGTTEFTLPFLARVWERVEPELMAREVELKVVHVRTRDSASAWTPTRWTCCAGDWPRRSATARSPPSTTSWSGTAKASLS